MNEFILIFNLAANALLILLTRSYHKIFVSVLFISNLYFCVGGAFYWVYVEDSRFVGFDWGPDAVFRAALTLSFATLGVAAIVCVASLLATPSINFNPLYEKALEQRGSTGPRSVLWMGIIAAVFVLASGVVGGRGPLFLIAYQFADMMVPAIVFAVAIRGFTRTNIVYILFFAFFVIMVGLRYKLALLAIPVAVVALTRDGKSLSSRLLMSSLFMVLVLALFAVMTLFRSKFSGLDFSRDTAVEGHSALYGLFAETNLLFGLSSVLEKYVDASNYFPLDPFIDSVKELIPRILLADRTTGAYVVDMILGLKTGEGQRSGTTYPFIGEYGIMGGWFGIVAGVCVFSGLYLALAKLIHQISKTKGTLIAGVALLAATMAYYNYSRGYLPQATKGYLFVVLPYIWLCSKTFAGSVPRPVSAQAAVRFPVGRRRPSLK